MNKIWIDNNGNFWDGISIVLDNMRIFNPSEEQLIAAGYTEYIEPEPTPEQLLERARQEKIAELEAYDQSDAVNGFDIVIGGQTIVGWLTPEKRANYKNSVDSAELLGMEVVHPVFNGVTLELPVTLAKTALARIQIYADQCFGVTDGHRAAIESLDNIQDIEGYVIERGYPERLVFEIEG